MLKKILILSATLAFSLALSSPLMAESTYVGNGLVEAGSDSGETARGEMDLGGWTDVGSGITVSNDSIVGVRSSDADPE